MSILQDFIRAGKDDRPVYVSQIRDAFQREGTRPFHFHVLLYDDSVRRFALKLPEAGNGEEARFLESYLNATLYNVLSSLGAKAIHVFVDPADASLAAYAEALNRTFQVDAPLDARTGYGKCLNVNARTLAGLRGADVRFRFTVSDIARERAVSAAPPSRGGRPVFAALPDRAKRGMLMGMDVGGTDVKLAASWEGRLCAFKEYDWNPAGFTLAEQLLEPLALLTRLMRAVVCMEAAGLGDRVPTEVFERSATDGAIRAATERMEALLCDDLRGFDGVGLCFPDVVVRNRVVGGETPKTQGLRENKSLDYEAQFAKLADLCEWLRPFVRPGGVVKNINDGAMAAFTAAVELASAGRDLSGGFFAHTLGTDLGTGWVLPDGSIPDIPLEVYNFIIDLGSFGQRAFAAGDVRSVRSFNTDLPGAVQRCAGQSGVFRLAAKHLPEADPDAYRGAFDRGLFRWEGSRLVVPSGPPDMRKACLEYFMRAAEDKSSASAEIFRHIGECLAVTWQETQYLLEPACASRTLFGRLVKTPACFELLREGARRLVPDLELEAADDALALTPLMRQLAADPGYTVAQFGQSVGAIHYACAGLAP